jgi:hypothetical protein
MEISEVKRRVSEAIERSRRAAANRRTRADEAAREWGAFLDHVAVPVVRQVSNVLKAEGYPFGVFTPGGSVRLMSERTADDYIELTLDTSGDEPFVMGHSRRSRGRRISESERSIGRGPIRNLTEEDVLAYLLKELEPFVEK